MSLKSEEEKIKNKLKELKDEELKDYHKKAIEKEEPKAIELAQKELTKRGIFW
ncbi:MAG: hypothetical protein ACRC1T_10830 [Clostridium chrysemydis]|uniref:hypothetical protein n=1 Tax=Clostridium chrysemydis TaxID=2665504 RepID=UPI003F3CC71E